MRKASKKPMLNTVEKLAFSGGSLAYSAVQQACSSLIIFFGMTAHNMPPFLMGLALALSLLWDSVIDPIVGYVSDKTDSIYFGRRYGYIIAAVFLLSLINVLLWSVPQSFHPAVKFIWFFGFLILFNTLQSLLQTPYHALSLELCGDTREKNVMNSFKSVAWLTGLLVPAIVMGVFLNDAFEISQYMSIAYICSTVLLLCGLMTVLSTYRHLPRLRLKAEAAPDKQKYTIKQIIINFFVILRSGNFRAIMIGYAVTLMSLALISSLGLFFFRIVFGLEFFEIAILMGIMFLAAVATQFLWNTAAQKYGKKRTLSAAIVIAIVGVAAITAIFIAIQYAGVQSGNILLVLCPGMLLLGAGFGAMLTLPTSMFNEHIAILSQNDERLKTGTYNAHTTFAYKFSQAVTLALIGIALQIARVKPAIEQTNAVQSAVGWILLGGMFLSLGAGLFMYLKYAVTPELNPADSNPAESNPIEKENI